MATISCERTSTESELIMEETTVVEPDIESDQNPEMEVEEQPLNDEETVNELYQTDIDVFFGVYRVENEGYTWSLYRGLEGELGWIANEWIDIYAI